MKYDPLLELLTLRMLNKLELDLEALASLPDTPERARAIGHFKERKSELVQQLNVIEKLRKELENEPPKTSV